MLYHIIIKCLCQLTLLTLVIKTQSVTLSFVKKCFLELSFTDDFNSQTKQNLAMDNMFINGVDTFAPVQPFFLVSKYRIVVRKYGGIVFCTATPNKICNACNFFASQKVILRIHKQSVHEWKISMWCLWLPFDTKTKSWKTCENLKTIESVNARFEDVYGDVEKQLKVIKIYEKIIRKRDTIIEVRNC